MEVSGQLHAPVLFPGGRVPSTQWIRGWVDPRAGLGLLAKREIPIIAPAGNSTPVVQPVA